MMFRASVRACEPRDEEYAFAHPRVDLSFGFKECCHQG
jgi:hypothetical protein